MGKGVPRKSTFVAKACRQKIRLDGIRLGDFLDPGSAGISVASSVASLFVALPRCPIQLPRQARSMVSETRESKRRSRSLR